MDDLKKQVEAELREIELAPKVPLSHYTGNIGRCSFCGKLARDLKFVETIHGIDRYKGECCHGGRNQ